MKTAAAFLLLMACVAAKAETAEDVLDKAINVMNRKSGVRASFALTTERGKTFTGTVWIKGDKLKLVTNGASLWFDGSTLWTYITRNEEVNVTNPSDEMVNRVNPAKLLAKCKNDYTHSMERDGTDYVINMTATSSATDISEMTVTINSSNSHVSQIKFKMPKGWNTVDISDIDTSAVDDATFVFNAKDYPQAEIIDLR